MGIVGDIGYRCAVRYLVLTVVAEDRQVDAANEKAGVCHSKWSWLCKAIRIGFVLPVRRRERLDSGLWDSKQTRMSMDG